MDKKLQLSNRQQLVFEACQKISVGERMVEEGMIELRNLMPEAKTVAPKILRSTKKKTKQPSLTNTDVEVKVLDVVRNESYVTVQYVMKKLKIAWSTANKALQTMRANGILKLTKKVHNPSHKGTSVYNREYPYWEVA